MNYTAYSGNWIVCGSYALVQAADLCYSTLIPLENSTGASFGVSCGGEDYFGTRILSVFRDFHYGIDQAAPLWGLRMKRVDGVRKDVLEELLRDPYIDRVVIGPVNMTRLFYLPLSQQYRCADHFVACIRENRNLWQLIDSEGMPGLLLTPEKIINMLSVQNIPEAHGRYTARAVIDVNVSETAESREARIRYTLKVSQVNLREARENGQGYRAFQRCGELVRDMPASRNISLIYCVDHLIQRKIMLLQLLQETECYRVAAVSPDIRAEVNRFIETAGALRGKLGHGKAVFQHLFERLAEAEDRITLNWEEWVKL